MAREHKIAPSLDELTATTVADYAIADSQILRSIDRRQWALLTGWGGPGHCAAAEMERTAGSGTAAFNTTCRVPPGVTAVQVGCLASGLGTVTFDVGLTGAPVLEFSTAEGFADAELQWSGMDESDSDNPALSVLSAADDAWTDVQVTVTLANNAGLDLAVYAIAWAPVRESDVTWP